MPRTFVWLTTVAGSAGLIAAGLVTDSPGLLAAGAFLVAIALSIPAVLLSFRRDLRETSRDIQVSFREELQRRKLGVLLCDYVDVGTLQTLAVQYEVSPEPHEVEHLTASKSGQRAEVGVGTAAKFGLEGEESQTYRALYKLSADPHVLTDKVIDAIAKRDGLRSDLATIPPIGLNEIEQLATSAASMSNYCAEHTSDSPDATLARRLLEALLRQALRTRFRAAADSNEFLLIDTRWLVQVGDDAIRLQLAQLQSGVTIEPAPQDIGLQVAVPVPVKGDQSGTDLLTPQGKQRLQSGAVIPASVFGRPAYFDEESSILHVSPITVFSRIGVATPSSTMSAVAASLRSLDEKVGSVEAAISRLKDGEDPDQR
jgi:hypothetical protein